MVAITGVCETCGGQVIPGALDHHTLRREPDRCLQCSRTVEDRCDVCGHLSGEDRVGHIQRRCEECG